MPSCRKCDKVCTGSRGNPSVQCTGCQSIFHISCCKISKDLVERLKDGSVYWKCDTCRVVGRRSVISEDVPEHSGDDQNATNRLIPKSNSSGATLDDVQSSIIELTNRFKGIEDSQNFISCNMDTLKNDLKIALNEIKTLQTQMARTENECKDLRERVNYLEASNDILLQQKNISTIVIRGIPANEYDNKEIVMSVLSKVHSEVVNGNIVDVVKLNNNTTTLQNYIVKLSSIDLKNEICKKMKSLHLCAGDLGIEFSNSASSKIFIMHKLTPLQSKLYYEAKQIKRQQNFRFLWVKDGVIMLRKTESSKVYYIRSINDINNINKTHQS